MQPLRISSCLHPSAVSLYILMVRFTVQLVVRLRCWPVLAASEVGLRQITLDSSKAQGSLQHLRKPSSGTPKASPGCVHTVTLMRFELIIASVKYSVKIPVLCAGAENPLPVWLAVCQRRQ